MNPDHEALASLADQLRSHVEVRDRRYHLKTYPKCFLGTEACAWLVDSGVAVDLDQALALGNMLLQQGHFQHVVREHEFENAELFYRFAVDQDHGAVPRKQDGTRVSWMDLLTSGKPAEERTGLLSSLGEGEDPGQNSASTELGVSPLDAWNSELLDLVHPRAWTDPTPKQRYNLVVIGAGAGGLVTASAAAQLGARVALVEAQLMGGDCLNSGCVPSKALLRSAKAVAAVRGAYAYGVRLKDGSVLADAVEVDFGAVMERMRRLRTHIAHHDSVQRFTGLGVDVFIGRATFTSKHTVSVNGQELRFARAVIATGGSPTLPPIPGLAEAPYLTNETLFNLTRRPPRLGVLGAGVIGVEMAQAMARLGSRVTVIQRGKRILPREDPDAADLVHAALVRDGVQFEFEADSQAVRHEPAATEDAWPTITVSLAGRPDLEFDALLVATGRRPNVQGIGLEAAGVASDPRAGVEVNDFLQTTNPDVYAVGDVCTRYRFTHAAGSMAAIVVRNALFYGRAKFSQLVIPWCTYTEPEVAHVGLYERDLTERGIRFRTFDRQLADVDRAIVDEQTEGFVRVHVREGTDEILGATIVGGHAGDMISEITTAIHAGMGVSSLASVIHPYPTTAEAIRQIGDLYNRTRLTNAVKSVFRGLLALRR